jgi:hypothetical protein
MDKKLLKQLKIVLGSDRILGTSLAGYIKVSYKNIVELFGKPNSTGDDYKIDAEWEFTMNKKVMTIYNWKDGKNYNKEHGLKVSQITDWHIGSAEADVTEEINQLAHSLGGKAKKM